MLTHIVAKTIVFNEAGELLVLRRSADDTHRPGGSDFPGGKVEEGEDIFEGAVREIAEEVDLQFVPTDLQLIFATTKAGYNTDYKTDINIVWLGFVTKLSKDQSVVLSHEHQSFGWLTLDDAITDCDGSTQKSFLEAVRDHDLAGQLAITSGEAVENA